MKTYNVMHLQPQITVTAFLTTDKHSISVFRRSKTLLTTFKLEFNLMLSAVSAQWSVKSDEIPTLTTQCCLINFFS